MLPADVTLNISAGKYLEHYTRGREVSIVKMLPKVQSCFWPIPGKLGSPVIPIHDDDYLTVILPVLCLPVLGDVNR